MSYREKAAWASLVAFALVWGVYFFNVALAFQTGGSLAAVFTHIGIAACVLSTLPVSILTWRAPMKDLAPPDERERLVELRAARTAYFTGVVLMFAVAVIAAATGRRFSGPTPAELGFLVFNGLWLIVVVTELVRWTTQVILFRRLG